MVFLLRYVACVIQLELHDRARIERVPLKFYP
jgi:hypothetical protein